MGLAIVPSLLAQTPEQRYEERMNDLLDFMDEWHGPYDQKALRIVLAACYLHLFTDEPPIWIWLNSPARKLDTAIGKALGRLMFAPAAGTVANELKEQTSRAKALWVMAGMQGIFHRTPSEIEVSLRQLAEMERGELEWHPRGIALDGRQGPEEAFVWNGRITVIASAQALDRLQAERCRPLWPIVQNTFVNVRMNGWVMSAELRAKWSQFDPADYRKKEFRKNANSADEWAVEQLRIRLVNLMDFDRRDMGTKLTTDPQAFANLTYLGNVVSAVRGPGFDLQALFDKGMILAGTHARMMGKPRLDSEDAQLTRKVLLDCIPPPALEILRSLPLDGHWTLKQLRQSVRDEGGIQARIPQTIAALEHSQCLIRTRGKRTGPVPMEQTYYRVAPELATALMASF